MAEQEPATGSTPHAKAEALRALCGLSAAACRAALEANGGDVELALAAMIDAGDVKPGDLDLDLVSDELFGRAGHRAIGGVYGMPSKSARPFVGAVTAEDVARVVAEQKRKLEEQGKDFKSIGARDRASERIRRRFNALKKNPRVVELPPLPRLTMTLSEWEGTDALTTWRVLARKERPAGTFSLTIPRAENDDDANPTPPAPEMVAAYGHLKAHEREVTAAVLDAFRTDLNAILAKHDLGMKPVKSTAKLKAMMELDALRMSTVARDGMAYLGLSFKCTWDEEHGAGVLLHGSRVVEVGDSDAARDTFAALDDGGKEIGPWSRGLDNFRDPGRNPFEGRGPL